MFYTLLFLGLALAKEFVPCNPVKDRGCRGVNKALLGSVSEDFLVQSLFFDVFAERGTITYGDKGAKLTISKRFDNPSLRSTFYIMFGRVEVICRSAPGRGVISSVFLQSDDLDEIDLEWIGGSENEVQTNYFAKGDTSDYTRGGYHRVPNVHKTFHNYTINWTPESLSFYIDEEVVREISNDEKVRQYGYPQTPMAVFMGIWVGGDPDNAPGTIEWAGGLTDFSEGPFSMEVQYIGVTDYSSGHEYRYTDSSGEWGSISSIGGEVNSRIGDTMLEMITMGRNLNKVRRKRLFIQFSGREDESGSSKIAIKMGAAMASVGALWLIFGLR